MRPFTFLLAILVASSAASQPVGWTIDAQPNAGTPAAFKVSATRTVGQAKLVYERSMLGGISYKLEQDGCTSSSSGAGYDLSGAERISAIRDAMLQLARDKDGFCKVPAAAIGPLTTGIDQAIAAADAAFDKGRPTIIVSPRNAARDGWALQDKPGEMIEGLVTAHVLTMRKAAGPVLLTYTIDLPLYIDKVSAGSRAIAGKVKECDYGDSDNTEFVIPANRAKAFRKTVEANLTTTGCDITVEQAATALTGFEAAYAMLDGWAAERLDERRTMMDAAGADGAMSSGAAAMSAAEAAADAAAMAK